MFMRVSIGTAHVLGLKEIEIDALPTTAYLMHGEGCRRNCKFCAQARESGANSKMLSRVVWPKYELGQVVQGLGDAKAKHTLKRCCIQVVDDGQEEDLKAEVEALVKTGIPLCVSKGVGSLEEIEQLLKLGVERVTVALDAIEPEIYAQVKGGSFQKRWDFLLEAANAFPGHVGTHMIVGLGESEEDGIRKIAELACYDVHVALFAFTPLKGTALAHMHQPEEENYRRVQLAHYLIMEKGFTIDDFEFANGVLVGFSREKNEVLELLTTGKAFQTSGCPDCNRPYYNERPGGVIYNYPRPLQRDEIYEALKSTKLWNGMDIYVTLKK